MMVWEKNYPKSYNKIIQYLRKYEHYEFPLLDPPPTNLENMITYLYGFDEYWKEVDDIIVRKMNGEYIYENQLDKYLLWNRLMRNSFVKLLGNLMDKFYKLTHSLDRLTALNKSKIL